MLWFLLSAAALSSTGVTNYTAPLLSTAADAGGSWVADPVGIAVLASGSFVVLGGVVAGVRWWYQASTPSSFTHLTRTR